MGRLLSPPIISGAMARESRHSPNPFLYAFSLMEERVDVGVVSPFVAGTSMREKEY